MKNIYIGVMKCKWSCGTCLQ